mgnify:CR=1 FL=1|tara:strand:- start:4344 stop:5333 length:990 start_codon:yes stop_codon:yes gene_type:complete
MAKIKIDNKIIEFDRIVAFGCSHTAGSELADHIILNKSLKETNEIKKKLVTQTAFYRFLREASAKPKILTHEGSVDSDSFFQTFESRLIDLNNSYSFINVLSNLLEAECKNVARGGGSIERSVFVLNDMISNNEIKTDGSDIVFLGITSRHRFFYIKNDGTLANSDGLLPSPHTWPFPNGVKNKKVHRDFLFNIFNDYYMLWKHYISIFSFIQIAKEYNIPVILQPVLVDLFHEKPWTDTGKEPEESMYQSIGPKSKWDDYSTVDISNWKHIQSLYKLWLKIKPYVIDYNNILADAKCKVEDPTPCGFGHDNISVHKKFAELLFDKLKI